MDYLKIFLIDRGITSAALAILGIVILGLLKYWGVFKKLVESERHYCYIFIAAILSSTITPTYLACTQELNWGSFFALTLIVFAFNQTLYNIFKLTSINALFVTILDFFKNRISEGLKAKTTETKEDLNK